MSRSVPQHKQSAPPGHVWIDEASRLTGRSIETLYKDRQKQKRNVPCDGPRSVTRGRKAAWRIADIEAWLAEDDQGVDPELLHNSRPAEPRLAA